jgi:hypothetical protein
MHIDERAPAIAQGGIEIDADAQIVWDVLTDIDEWPAWNPDLKTGSGDGGPPLDRGSVFRWKAGPGTITSPDAQDAPAVHRQRPAAPEGRGGARGHWWTGPI